MEPPGLAVLVGGVALVAIAGIAAVATRRVARVELRLGALVAGEASAAGETRTQIATLQQALQAQLAAVQHGVTTQVAQTNVALGDVRERLGAVQEQSREVTDLARDVGSLQDLLRPPRARGALGELMLEALLADALPGRFERQYEFRSTRTRVDAVVRVGDKLVPIDAKFPLAMYEEVTKASGDERRAKRRAFAAAVKRHVDDIAERYIVPRDGTIDLAFAYIPSEAVYYEVVVADAELDLRAYCASRRVLPVSPNTLLAFLAAVQLGLRGLAIQEGTRELQRQLGQLAEDLARLETDHEKLGRHLDYARAAHESTSRWITRVGERLRSASASAIDRPSQPVLPLDRVSDGVTREP